MERSAARASALVALAACCFGSISILTVIGTRAGVSLTTLLAWRYLLAVLPLALAAGPSRLRMPFGRGVATLFVGGVGQAIVGYLTLSALRWIDAPTLGFLFYTYPAWVAVFAMMRGAEHIDRRKAFSLALSFTGIVLMVGAPRVGGVAWPGVAFGLAGALSYALYLPFLHRLEAETSPTAGSTYVIAGAGITFLIAALVDGSFTLQLTRSAWASATTLALVCTVGGFVLLLRGMASLGPVRAAIVCTVEPFWTALLGVLALGQPLTLATLAGGALIATAVLLIVTAAPRAVEIGGEHP